MAFTHQCEFFLLEVIDNFYLDEQLLMLQVCKSWNRVVQYLLRKTIQEEEELDLSYSPQLFRIPNTFPLTNLRILDCSNCSQLVEIPNTLTNLRKLDCSNCQQITTIPNTLTNLRKLDCKNCQQITTIPNTLTNLRELNCSRCVQIIRIPHTKFRWKFCGFENGKVLFQ